VCGIIGIYTEDYNEQVSRLLYQLAMESSIRGLHAFGWAYYSSNKIITNKQFGLPELVDLREIDKQHLKLIYHNRYSTSGDWKMMGNNQPITINNDISVAMNGVITMAPPEEWAKKYELEFSTENDTEIFARFLEIGGDPEEFVAHMKGSFAAVFLWKGKLWALRNNRRPLHWFEHKNSVFVVSTQNIINRSVYGVKSYIVKPNKLVNVMELLHIGE